MSRTWLSSCTRAPGPEANLNRYPASYGVPNGANPYGNQMLGVVNHSAGGNFSAGNTPVDVMVSRGNSWHITIFKDGRKEQHFALEAMCWGAGPKSNYRHEQIEHDGGPDGNPSEPLTTLALASTIEVQSEICRIRAWDSVKRGVTGFEHNEFMYTDCPSDRIPWAAIEKGTREASMPGILLAKPIVGMASMPKGNGYWLVSADGGIFAFGKAEFHGSAGAIALTKPIVGMAATQRGKGYWLVAADGGIFCYGDARFFGSTGAINLAKPITGMVATPRSNGYWLVAADGGIFAYGQAVFLGSISNPNP